MNQYLQHVHRLQAAAIDYKERKGVSPPDVSSDITKI